MVGADDGISARGPVFVGKARVDLGCELRERRVLRISFGLGFYDRERVVFVRRGVRTQDDEIKAHVRSVPVISRNENAWGRCKRDPERYGVRGSARFLPTSASRGTLERVSEPLWPTRDELAQLSDDDLRREPDHWIGEGHQNPTRADFPPGAARTNPVAVRPPRPVPSLSGERKHLPLLRHRGTSSSRKACHGVPRR